ncbi:hypothetical protein ACFSWE_16480 [Leucobacter albus]|uniref:Lipoprotein n=1 Tax=Leucobacter albus TaxID=272210 RepID=A0ABW3TTG5_9MICO
MTARHNPATQTVRAVGAMFGACVLALSLAGCADSGADRVRAVLARDATSADSPPPEIDAKNVSPGSFRLVGADSAGTEYYLGTHVGEGVCLLVYPVAEGWTLGCGAAEGLSVGAGATTAWVGAADLSGMTATENLAETVYIRQG